MADKTPIEWTDATWNPITGCSLVSPGCTNCYAMGLAGTRLKHHPSRKGLTVDTKAGPVWNGTVRMNEEWLTQPLQWKRPRMIFVCAHGDLFHESVPDAWIDRVFAVMALAPQHTFQVLTKRSARMRAYLGRPGDERRARHEAVVAAGREISPGADWHRIGPVDANRRNVWLGISAEDQTRYDERSGDILGVGWAGPLFVSAEPLLGSIDLGFRRDHCDLCGSTGILARWPKGTCHECNGRGSVVINGATRRDGYRRFDWIVVGGENGPRPPNPKWVRDIRDQCASADVPFFFKQWGTWEENTSGHAITGNPVPGSSNRFDTVTFKDGAQMNHVGKRRAGRLLDGVEHNAMPEVRP